MTTFVSASTRPAGGAITYVSTLDGLNIINSFDWGRQIQQSYYSGPPNYTREGKEKSPSWASFCWNPIQSGDSFGNGAQVLELEQSATELYVKTRPMLWPMCDDAGECFFETWITLDGATFTWRARLTNQRGDTHQYGAHSQELPSIYTNGPWDRLISYTGDAPYTGGEMVEIRNDHKEWAAWSKQWWAPERSVELRVKGDGHVHWYTVDLAGHPGYRGLLTGLAIDIPDCVLDTHITLRDGRLLASGENVK